MAARPSLYQLSYRRYGKRVFDLFTSVILLLLLLPLFVVLALLVWAFHGRPIWFKQVRPGRGGRPFVLRKFRTMRDTRDADGQLLPDERRLTAFGRFLRRTSLDELPELWNVVCGEMSLVGPRPLLLRYLPYFRDEEKRRFDALPGITGWAQVNGRNDLEWDARFASDVWYVENLSLALDLRILLLTVLQVLRCEHTRVVPRLSLRDLDEERR